MKWIILIGDDKFNLDLIREIEHFGCVSMANSNSDRMVVDYGYEHIFYDYVQDLINDYEEEELLSISFPNPKFIMMTYTSDELMKRVLKQNNYLKEVYVDDDNGLILPMEKYILQL